MRRGKEVRVGAKCKHCKKHYSGLSSGGTGHLTRHIPKCPVLKGHRASGANLCFSSILMDLLLIGSTVPMLLEFNWLGLLLDLICL